MKVEGTGCFSHTVDSTKNYTCTKTDSYKDYASECSFSIGDGNYIRPYSRTCLFLIKY